MWGAVSPDILRLSNKPPVAIAEATLKTESLTEVYLPGDSCVLPFWLLTCVLIRGCHILQAGLPVIV